MLNLAELEKLYGAMSDEKFASIRREGLLDAALPYYDREARRRGFPITVWLAESAELPQRRIEVEAEVLAISTPDSEQILQEANKRRALRWSELNRLATAASMNKGPWNVFLMYRRRIIPPAQRGDNLIVWLRRFHVKRRGRFHFDDVLVPACQGFGLPLTVRDSTFKSSENEFAPSFLPVMFLWGIVGTVIIIMVMFREQTPEMVAVWSLLFPILILFQILLGRQFGYRKLNNLVQGRETTLSVIQEIRERRGRHGDHSVIILRCQDDFWRDIVRLCLEHTSAVVIDVTEASENVIWELKTSLHLMAPQSIILACGLGPRDPEELPADVLLVLAAELGAHSSSQVQHFFYAQDKDQIDLRFGTRETMEIDLRARLAIAVAYSNVRPNL